MARACSTNSARITTIPHRRSGKLIVARDEHEVQALEALLARATDNGVQGMEIVEQAFIREREPHLKDRVALYLAKYRDAQRRSAGAHARQALQGKGCVSAPGSPLEGADADADGVVLRTPAESIGARTVVNAAGLYADEVSAMLGGKEFQIYPCRGEYAELVPAKRDLVNGLVYPLPHTHGLGVHITKTVAGNVTFGPTVKYQDRKDDYERRSHSARRFSRTCAAAAP